MSSSYFAVYNDDSVLQINDRFTALCHTMQYNLSDYYDSTATYSGGANQLEWTDYDSQETISPTNIFYYKVPMTDNTAYFLKNPTVYKNGNGYAYVMMNSGVLASNKKCYLCIAVCGDLAKVDADEFMLYKTSTSIDSPVSKGTWRGRLQCFNEKGTIVFDSYNQPVVVTDSYYKKNIDADTLYDIARADKVDFSPQTYSYAEDKKVALGVSGTFFGAAAGHVVDSADSYITALVHSQFVYFKLSSNCVQVRRGYNHEMAGNYLKVSGVAIGANPSNWTGFSIIDVSKV